MTRRRLLLLWGLLAASAWLLPGWLPQSGAREEGFPEQSPRALLYEIDARLDADTHTIEATGRLTWRNDAPVPADEICLHLYLNAFRDRRSAFLMESQGAAERFDPHHPGGIELTRFERDGEDLLVGSNAIYPAENGGDRTVLRVSLPEAIQPGESATFDLAWTSRLPQVVARSGFGGPFHLAAQWYPKPGVFAAGGPGRAAVWHCHAYHATSEFFADYGVYRVRLRVPAAYAGRVGATGAITDPAGEVHADGSVTYEVFAEDVHDFAWVCDDDFVVREYAFEGGDGTAPQERARMREILGRDPGPLPPVTVRILLQPGHEHLAERYRRAAFETLSLTGHWFGPYPYPVLTIVDPDARASRSGGMEYPTLVMAGAGNLRRADAWKAEHVVVHELVHQHFQGLVGTNEPEDPWMDEGLTTWATARVMSRVYGPQPVTTRYRGLDVAGERPLAFDGWLAAASRAAPWIVDLLRAELDVPLLGRLWPTYGPVTSLSFLREVPTLTLVRLLPLDAAEHERTQLAAHELVDPVAGRATWRHLDGGSLLANAYLRTAAVLRTVEAHYGESTMLRFVRAYCERYRFRHPVLEDLLAVWRDTAEGEDLRPLLADLFDGLDHVDHAVSEIRELGADGGQEVVLRRYGLASAIPVEVLVRFDDGSSRRFEWDATDAVTAIDGGAPAVSRAPPHAARVDPERPRTQGRWQGLVFPPAPGERKRVVSAEVDPRRVLHLDRDRTNDGRRVGSDARPGLGIALRCLGWVELNTSFYGGL